MDNMTGYGYGYGYPQIPQYRQQVTQPIRSQIIEVSGQPGAQALNLAPNCSALLLDNTAPIVWLAKSDGAGYKTVTPYKITPYEPETLVDITGLEKRIERLEAAINGKPDSDGTKAAGTDTKSNGNHAGGQHGQEHNGR